MYVVVHYYNQSHEFSMKKLRKTEKVSTRHDIVLSLFIEFYC
jgi:hypothetical protein